MIPAEMAETTARTETVTVETEGTETVTVETEETETVTAEMTETATATAGVIVTATGMIPGLSQDLTRDRSAAEITAAVMRKDERQICCSAIRGNVCLTFPFLFGRLTNAIADDTLIFRCFAFL